MGRPPVRPPGVGVYIKCHGSLMPLPEVVNTPEGISISKQNRSGYGCRAFRGDPEGYFPHMVEIGPQKPDLYFKKARDIAEGTFSLESHPQYLAMVHSKMAEEILDKHPIESEDTRQDMLRYDKSDISDDVTFVGETIVSNNPADTWRVTRYSPERSFQTSRTFHIYVSEVRKIELWSCTRDSLHAFLGPITPDDHSIEDRISDNLFHPYPILTTTDLFDIFKILHRQGHNQFNIVDTACHGEGRNSPEESRISPIESRRLRPEGLKYGGKKRNTKRKRK